MREIHLLENKEACARFVLGRTSQGFSPETFLGIGSFSSQIPSTGKGVALRSIPHFFESELTESVVQGHFSVFERESLLMQVGLGEIGNIPISRWLLVGLHLSIFYSPKIDVKRYLPTQDLINVRSPEEFMQVYLGNLFPHIQEIRAQSVLFLFDMKSFCDYVVAFFIWLSNHLNLLNLKELVSESYERELRKKVTNEFLWYLADSALHPCIAVYPSTQACFNDLICSARNIKKHANLPEDIVFRL